MSKRAKPSSVLADEQRAEVIRHERELLVAYLRRQASLGVLSGPNPFVTLRAIVDAIERGEHATGDKP